MRKSVLVNDGGDGMGSFHLLMEREPPTSLESIARFSLRVQREGEGEGEDVFMQTSDGVMAIEYEISWSKKFVDRV